MAESHFLSGLKQRRAERLGGLETIRAEIAALEAREVETVEQLSHLDALLKSEDPSIKLDAIRPRKARGSSPRFGAVRPGDDAKRLPVTKAVLRLLRTEGIAMTVDQVVARLEPDYADLERKKLVQNVRMFMSAKKSAGVLHANEDEGRPLRYGIAA